MPRKPAIPLEIQADVQKLVEHGKPSPICRLTWTGAMDKWDFAIYKYSDEQYDPEEWFFTGAVKVYGTVTGAMEAGMEAYPM